MPKLYIMVGVPGSGKSTYAEDILSKSATIFSSDKLRGELLGDENRQDNKDLIFSTLYDRARTCILRGGSAVIDATNVTKSDRLRVLRHFADIEGLEKIAVVVLATLDECISRNAMRERKVPDKVIADFYNKLEKPVLEEGFDFIMEV